VLFNGRVVWSSPRILGVTVKVVALLVLHAKLMICPVAVTAGVAAKPVIVGADGPPPPLPPLPPPLPLPLPPELEDPPPHATVKLKPNTAANHHALRKQNILCDLPVDSIGLVTCEN
jgi:hypothetical protein